MSRLWRLVPPAILVTASGEIPTAFDWQGQTHSIASISNHWLIERDWWRGGIERDYFLVVTTSGLWAEIFHNRLTDMWHLQRLYD